MVRGKGKGKGIEIGIGDQLLESALVSKVASVTKLARSARE